MTVVEPSFLDPSTMMLSSSSSSKEDNTTNPSINSSSSSAGKHIRPKRRSRSKEISQGAPPTEATNVSVEFSSSSSSSSSSSKYNIKSNNNDSIDDDHVPVTDTRQQQKHSIDQTSRTIAPNTMIVLDVQRKEEEEIEEETMRQQKKLLDRWSKNRKTTSKTFPTTNIQRDEGASPHPLPCSDNNINSSSETGFDHGDVTRLFSSLQVSEQESERAKPNINTATTTTCNRTTATKQISFSSASTEQEMLNNEIKKKVTTNQTATTKTKSILRKPKYTNATSGAEKEDEKQIQQEYVEKPASSNCNDDPYLVRDVVMERPKKTKKTKVSSKRSVVVMKHGNKEQDHQQQQQIKLEIGKSSSSKSAQATVLTTAVSTPSPSMPSGSSSSSRLVEGYEPRMQMQRQQQKALKRNAESAARTTAKTVKQQQQKEKSTSSTGRKTVSFQEEGVASRRPKSMLMMNDFLDDKSDKSNNNRNKKSNNNKSSSNNNNITEEDNNENSNKKDKNDINEEKEEPMIFNSLADLMEAAGTLPSQDIAKEGTPKAIEAEIRFSCMDPSEYEERLKNQRRRKEQQRRDYPKEEEEILETDNESNDKDDMKENLEDPPPGNENNNNNNENPVSDDDDDDFDDDNIWDIASDDEEDGTKTEPVLRPTVFIEFWTAISHWITPEAVIHVQKLQQQQKQQQQQCGENMIQCDELIPVVDTSDLGASRRSGLMALLRIHLPGALNELFDLHHDRLPPTAILIEQQQSITQRFAEHALANLLRCFDFTYSMPTSLGNIANTKALTCILLDTVLLITTIATTSTNNNNQKQVVPTSCQEVGLGPDEYRYLTRSALIQLGASHSDA